MSDIHDRLEKELESVMDRLRQLGGAVVIEEPDALSEKNVFADPAEATQVYGGREIDFATRSRLVERANRLAEALQRLRDGQYGICEECGAPIAPARLKALPEATMCVRCQDRREREAREAAGAEKAPSLSAMRKRNRRSLRSPRIHE